MHFLSLVILFTGCAKEFKDPSELTKYLSDKKNDLQLERVNHPFVIKASYIPSDLLLSREMRSYRNAQEFSENKLRYDTMLYFNLRISLNNKKVESNFVRDTNELNKIVSYLSDGITKDLYIVSDGDTLHAMGVMYDGNFGQVPDTGVLVAFSKSILSEHNDQLSLYFSDSMLGSGRSVFEFSKKDIKRVPPLKLKQL